MKSLLANRWFLASFFYLSSTLNYLDRVLLGAMAPHLMKVLDFGLPEYGSLQSLFYIVYSICSPLAGFLLDRFGLNRGVSVAVAIWSLAGILRGYVDSYWGLVAASCLLAVGESAGIPATAKFAQRYLKPAERAVGAGISQLGLTLGAFLAPVIVNTFRDDKWQYAFLIPGVMGFLWIPIWLGMTRHHRVAEPPPEPSQRQLNAGELIRDRGMWALFAGNLLGMVPYAVWSGPWTTIYFTETYKLTQQAANEYGKYSHLLNYAGALGGGWISMMMVKRGMRPANARLRVCAFVAAGQMLGFLIPMAPTPLLATVGICFTYALAAMWGVNFYTLPVDRYGHASAAFAVSLLTSAYGVLNIVINPWIGRTVAASGFQPVCILASICPIVAFLIVWLNRPAEERT
jgi:MFS transporter, ACS family, hexuronate transporter